jgi:delta-aminolevulinic acid dehydratase/porphobilinogen synthase
MSDVKAGNDTSEFKWEKLSTAIAMIPPIIAFILEFLDKGSTAAVILAGIMSVAVKLGSVFYSKSRGLVKSSASLGKLQPPPA